MRWMTHDGKPTDILTDESIRRMTSSTTRLRQRLAGQCRENRGTRQFSGGSSFLRGLDGTCWAIAVNTRSKRGPRALDQLPWKIKRAVTTWGEGDLFSQDVNL